MIELPFLIQPLLQILEVFCKLVFNYLSEFIVGFEPSNHVAWWKFGFSIVKIEFGGVIISSKPEVKYFFESLLIVDRLEHLAVPIHT